MPFDKELSWARTYQNPVYPRSFPDPFVMKFRGEYFAYCTDFWHDGRVFGVLRSRDLVNWTEAGGAMDRLDSDAPFYWAPEVFYFEGKFYLYYSVGNETLMELRVAVSDRPDGGFVDSGKRLSTEDFAIDAHVFTDSDGRRYLFYATDFLDYEFIGTGTVVDELVDPFTLARHPRPVTRARYDWQVYDPARKEKGGVRWHTVEGPFVIKRKGVYYEMFSGGNWQNVTYGVSFAVSESLAHDGEWDQYCDGDKALPILRTIPGRIIGPGHNSVVRGPNNREIFCVYHRWTEAGRALAIDRMDFAGQRMFVKGATDTKQPAPLAPSFADNFADAHLSPKWRSEGDWTVSGGEAFGRGRLSLPTGSTRFFLEFWLRAFDRGDNHPAGIGFALESKGREVFRFDLGDAPLPASFDASVLHRATVEADDDRVRVTIDDWFVAFDGKIDPQVDALALVAENVRAGFSGVALTRGFEDLFDVDLLGWRELSGRGEFELKDKNLQFTGRGDALLAKGRACAGFEFVANAKVVAGDANAGALGFAMLDENDAEIFRFTLFGDRGGLFHLAADDPDLRTFALPQGFRPGEFNQFRFVKTRSRLSIELERHELGSISIAETPARIAVCAADATIALDMVRVTEI